MSVTNLKTYVRTEEVKAVRITSKNWKEPSGTVDYGEGCILTDGCADSVIGDWLVVERDGNQIYPNSSFRLNFTLKRG